MIFRTCLAALLGLMLGAAALAQNSGSGSMLDTLFRKLQEASDPVAVKNLEAAIWELWTMPPNAGQRTLMVQGIAQMQAGDLNGALATFNELVKRRLTSPKPGTSAPRAVVARRLPASVKDICETLKREPRHFGALSGLGMIRAEMNEPARAVAAFELARNTIRTSSVSTPRSRGSRKWAARYRRPTRWAAARRGWPSITAMTARG